MRYSGTQALVDSSRNCGVRVDAPLERSVDWCMGFGEFGLAAERLLCWIRWTWKTWNSWILPSPESRLPELRRMYCASTQMLSPCSQVSAIAFVSPAN